MRFVPPQCWRPWFERCSVLSFDVFDTALLRCVGDPLDVLTFVAREHRHRRGGEAMSRFDLRRERPCAEARARIARGHADVMLPDIYERLAPPGDWPVEVLQSLELEAERALSLCNPFVRGLAAWAKEQGKRLVFLSDMYLPTAFVADLLVAAGYDVGDGVWVSGAAGGRSKANGALYRHVVRTLGVRPAEILHIGDNFASDVGRALGSGIPACLYPRCTLRLPNALRHPSSDPAAMIHRGLCAARLCFDPLGAPRDFWYRFGFARLGLAWAAVAGDVTELFRLLGRSACRAPLGRLLSDGADDLRGQRLRRGATDFADDLARLRVTFPWIDIPPESARALIRGCVLRPTLEEAREYAAIDGGDARRPRG